MFKNIRSSIYSDRVWEFYILGSFVIVFVVRAALELRFQTEHALVFLEINNICYLLFQITVCIERYRWNRMWVNSSLIPPGIAVKKRVKRSDDVGKVQTEMVIMMQTSQ